MTLLVPRHNTKIFRRDKTVVMSGIASQRFPHGQAFGKNDLSVIPLCRRLCSGFILQSEYLNAGLFYNCFLDLQSCFNRPTSRLKWKLCTVQLRTFFLFSFKFREIIYNNVSINILNLLISYNWNSSKWIYIYIDILSRKKEWNICNISNLNLQEIASIQMILSFDNLFLVLIELLPKTH